MKTIQIGLIWLDLEHCMARNCS